MAGKESGLGDNFYVHGYDLSGDVNAVSKVGGGPAALDFTTINKVAHVRQGGRRDGGIDFTTFFEPSGVGPYVAGPAPLPTLPRTDQIVSYFRGTTVGKAAASEVCKLLNFDGTRAADGGLTFTVSTQANGYGVEWGKMLTAGIRTDAAPTAGTYYDDTAQTAYGAQAYLHVFAVAGTSVTVAVQHCDTSGGVYADLIAFDAVAVAGAPTAQRKYVSNTTTVKQFLKVTTTGTFTNAQFAVVFVRNEMAGIVF